MAEKRRSSKRVAKTLLIIFLLMIIAQCAWEIWSILSDYKKGNDTYEEAASFVSIPEKREEPISEESFHEIIPDHPSDFDDDTAIELAEEDEIDWPVVDFDALREINPDIVGWIYIEDTNINYPIAQGPDNSYYLSHMYNKQWDGYGCIFMDYLNSSDFSDPNSVIYGHHMQNGSMFQNLAGYKEQEYYETHKTAYLLTPEKNYQIILFAGYVASLKDDAWKMDFSEEEFEPWYMKAIGRSCFDSGIVPTPQSKIITLSTCSYEFNNARFVVLGILQ